MSEKLVSILVPIYNGSFYIKNCINALLNQSYKKIEIIIANDCSTDDTFLKIKKFKDKRIKIINNKKNIGVAETLNRALKLSKGEFIALNDIDDVSAIDRIEKQLKFLKKNKRIHLVASSIKIKKYKKNIKKRIIYHKGNLLKFYNIFNNYFTPSTFFFKREIYEKYKIKFRKQFEPSQDFDFVSQLYRKKLLLEIIEEPLVTYLERNNSLSQRRKKNIFLKSSTQICQDNISYLLKKKNYDNKIYQVSKIINGGTVNLRVIELNKLIRIIKTCFYKITKKKNSIYLVFYIVKFILFAYRVKYIKSFLIFKYFYRLFKKIGILPKISI